MKEPQSPDCRIKFAIKGCRKKPSLEAFLGCVNLSHDLSTGFDSLDHLLDEIEEKILQDDIIKKAEVFIDWLSTWEWVRSDWEQKRLLSENEILQQKQDFEDWRSKLKDHFGSDPSDHKDARLKQVMDTYAQDQNPHNKTRSSYQSRLHDNTFFPPAYEVADYLSVLFPGKRNPGPIIEDYIKLLFPSEMTFRSSNGPLRLLEAPPLCKVISRICRSIAEKIEIKIDDERSVLIPILLAEARDVLFHKCSLKSDEEPTLVDFSDNKEKRINLLTLWPKQKSSSFLTLTVKIILHEMELTPGLWLTALEVIKGTPFNRIESAAYNIFKHIIPLWVSEDYPFDQNEHKCSYTLSDDDLLEADQQIRSITNNYLDHIRTAERSTLPPHLFGEFVSSYWNFTHLFKIHDICFDETPTKFDGSIFMEISMWSSLIDHPLSIVDAFEPHINGPLILSDSFFDSRPNCHLRAWQRAVDHGLVEFGNAIIAFGITSQSIIGRSIKGWPKSQLSKILAQSPSTPGFDLLQHAIKAVVTIEPLDNSFALHQRWASSYLAEEVRESILPRNVGLGRDEIEARWKEGLGSSCWLWLFPETKRLLIDADVTYSRCHIDLGTGIINFGRFTLDYCMALEKELILRFQPVFTSLEFRSYKNLKNLPSKETFGTVIYLIRNHYNLPTDLQQKIHSESLIIHEDEELVRWLSLFHQNRNNAAHASTHKNSDLMEIRNLITPVFQALMRRIAT